MKIKNFKSKAGFSLVELLVSVAITAIIMVGISAFFSNGFSSMFQSRQQTSGALEQLVFSSVLQKQFIKAQSLQEVAPNGSFVVLKNDLEKTKFPFSYLGKSGDHIVLKDFFIFNGYEGATPSQNFLQDIESPAGITQFGGKFYVAAPLENAIYECTNSCNKKLPIEGLKYPMDLATDGESLYVTDAGNNRILKIEGAGAVNTVTVLATGFNFPTGIEYYSGEKGSLFVSDTYNHQVKAISLSGDFLGVIVGAGTNEKCDNTALYCKLSYPTGLVIGNDGQGEALYIADTGHGRILKVRDPGPMTDFDLSFSSPEVPTAIREIKFSFPVNTNLSNASLDEITSDNQALQAGGEVTSKDHIFNYLLWTKLIADTSTTNKCEPWPCLPSKNKIEVERPDLFNAQQYNELKLGDDANNILKVGNKNGSILSLLMNFALHHPADTEVVLATPILANTKIDFKFSGVDTASVAGGFKAVLIQMYDLDNKFLLSQKNTFRFGDKLLGTPEDMISVHAENLTYPTGLGWSGAAPVFSQTPEYPAEFKDFDYLSPFSTEALKFELKNEGSLLQITFKTLKNSPSENEKKVYDAHVFNLAIKP